MTGDGDRLQDVMEIWAMAVEDTPDGDLAEAIDRHRYRDLLLAADDEVLLDAALYAREPGERRTWKLPLLNWAAAVHAINSARRLATGNPWSFENAVLPALQPTSTDERHAIRLLEARARHRGVRHQADRIVRRKRLPLGEVPGLEDVDADAVETAAVLLLARTAPDGQFSSTGTGRVFMGWKPGFHQEYQRPYVDGLSSGLDHAMDVLDSHREPHWPPGGRFYVHPNGDVECALCRIVITRVAHPLAYAPYSRCTG